MWNMCTVTPHDTCPISIAFHDIYLNFWWMNGKHNNLWCDVRSSIPPRYRFVRFILQFELNNHSTWNISTAMQSSILYEEFKTRWHPPIWIPHCLSIRFWTSFPFRTQYCNLNFEKSLGPDPNIITPSHWKALVPKKSDDFLPWASTIYYFQFISTEFSLQVSLAITLTCLAPQLAMSLDHCSLAISDPLQHCWLL